MQCDNEVVRSHLCIECRSCNMCDLLGDVNTKQQPSKKSKDCFHLTVSFNCFPRATCVLSHTFQLFSLHQKMLIQSILNAAWKVLVSVKCIQRVYRNSFFQLIHFRLAKRKFHYFSHCTSFLLPIWTCSTVANHIIKKTKLAK